MSGQYRKVLLVGGNGMLARKVASEAPAEYKITAVDLPAFDMTDNNQVCSFVDAMQPEVIINCAAYTNVDGCEAEQELANRVNGIAVGYLAGAAKKVDATLVHISTDYVFDGEKTAPYVESDETNPQSVYGHSKLLGEHAILASELKKYFIIRTSWLYGSGGNNFVETILRLARERDELRIVADQVGTPTYTSDLAEAVFSLLRTSTNSKSPDFGHYGIYHFSNQGQCSWHDFACEIIRQGRHAGLPLKVSELWPITTDDYPLPAKRPAYSVFDKTKYLSATGSTIPAWQESLQAYFLMRDK